MAAMHQLYDFADEIPVKKTDDIEGLANAFLDVATAANHWAATGQGLSQVVTTTLVLVRLLGGWPNLPTKLRNELRLVLCRWRYQTERDDNRRGWWFRKDLFLKLMEFDDTMGVDIREV